jgi:hypothetical protein
LVQELLLVLRSIFLTLEETQRLRESPGVVAGSKIGMRKRKKEKKDDGKKERRRKPTSIKVL